MPIIFTTILGWFSSLAGKVLVDTGLRFLAYKTLAYTLMTVIFPVVIKNLLCWFFDIIQAIVEGNVDTSSMDSFSMQLTGMAGYIGSQLQIPTCITILLSACAIRFTLNFIPFVK